MNEATYAMTDRELDVAVAEKVMGWTKMRQRRAGEWCGVPAGSEAVYPVKEFSTDIAAAWQVVEKMRSDGYSFSCFALASFSSKPSPFAAFSVSVYPPTESDPCGYADEMPRAICIAALAAVAGE